MELIFFTCAFVMGFAALQLHLPPLIGFLLAGFALNLLGYESTETLKTIADLGVTILLFSIGLKLKLSSLTRPHVFASASLHLIFTTAVFSLLLLLLVGLGLPLFIDLKPEAIVLLAFAFSFSSTVFAVKVLEGRGEMASLHARTAIGILVMQDIFAVIFLATTTGFTVNIWAIPLILCLPLFKKLMFWVLSRSSHGEVLPLFGFFMALVAGYQGFDAAGIKGDLGALIMGMLLANHAKAPELAKSLLNFKDFMLVGFFLTIGLDAHLTLNAKWAALIMLAFLPFKLFLYYGLCIAFKLRARTSLFTTLSLANYSEFGLIVCAVAASSGALTGEWLTVMAIAVSASFVLATPLNTKALEWYTKWENKLLPYERKSLLDEEQPMDIGDAQVLIFGMGRIGQGAYDLIDKKRPGVITGVDVLPENVERLEKTGRTVIHADATDPDFWRRIDSRQVTDILLAMPKHVQNTTALMQMRAAGFTGKVAAVAYFQDEVKELEQLGADCTFNFYQEAGSGFAAHAMAELKI